MKFDVIIVGASIAGSICAIQLAQHGFEVALVDKAKFPRPKACGEGLSALAVDFIKKLNLSSNFFDLTHFQNRGYEISKNNKRFKIPTEQSGIGISRLVLDNFLLEQAAKLKNVSFISEEKIKTAKLSNQVYTLDSENCQFKANYLVIADGHHSPTARMFDFIPKAICSGRYGYSSTWRSEEELNHILIIPRTGFEVYITRVAPKIINVAILGEKEAINPRNCKLSEILNTTLITEASQETDFIGAGPFKLSRKKAQFDKLYLIGDAAETLDPAGGLGMFHAMASAELAVKSIVTNLDLEKQRQALVRTLRAHTAVNQFYLNAVKFSSNALPLAHLGLTKLIDRSLHQ